MSKKFQPKDQFLQSLVQGFEDSLKSDKELFFPEEELEKLVDFYESLPDYEKAGLVIEKGIALFPYSSTFYLKKAQINIMAKNFDVAREAIEQTKIFEPTSSELLLLESDLHTGEGNFKLAVEKLNQLYDLISPDEQADVLLELADVYEVANDQKKLCKTLQEVLLNFPSNEEAIHRYWNYVIDHDQFALGVDFIQKIIDRRPYNFLAWYYLAKCYEEVGLYEKASEAYEYSIAINDYYFAYWDYGLCLQESEQFEKAVANYNEMLELFDNEDNIYLEIGHCYLANSEFVYARKAYHSALDLAADVHKKAQAHYYIGKAFQMEGQLNFAIAQFKKCTEFKSNKSKYWDALGKAQFASEDFEAASKSFIQSLALNDHQPNTWIRLAKAYFQLNLHNELLEALKKSIIICPSHAKLHYHFSAYLLHFGHTQNGLLILEHALNLDRKKKNSIFALFPHLENVPEVLELLDQFES